MLGALRVSLSALLVHFRCSSASSRAFSHSPRSGRPFVPSKSGLRCLCDLKPPDFHRFFLHELLRETVDRRLEASVDLRRCVDVYGKHIVTLVIQEHEYASMCLVHHIIL